VTLHMIYSKTITCTVDEAQLILCERVPLLRRSFEPLRCLGEVLKSAVSSQIQQSKLILRVGFTIFRTFLIQLNREVVIVHTFFRWLGNHLGAGCRLSAIQRFGLSSGGVQMFPQIWGGPAN